MLGLLLLGIETIHIAPASTQAWVVVGGMPLGLQSTITQVILVALVMIVLVLGLEIGSRLAWVVALVIGGIPLLAWLALVAAGHPTVLEPMPVRLAATSLLVVAGLGVEWPIFWSAGPDRAEDAG